MYLINFTTESGDNYILGPFQTLPKHDEVMALLPTAEQEYYVDEGAADNIYGEGKPMFYAYSFSTVPGIMNSGRRIPIPRITPKMKPIHSYQISQSRDVRWLPDGTVQKAKITLTILRDDQAYISAFQGTSLYHNLLDAWGTEDWELFERLFNESCTKPEE